MKITKIILLIIFFSLIFIPLTQIHANCNDNDEVCLDNPLTGTPEAQDPELLIGQIINGVLGIVGSLALVMFIYGGFTWMLAAGESSKVQKGKDIIIWAVVGLVVIFSAYAMVKFVLDGIKG